MGGVFEYMGVAVGGGECSQLLRHSELTRGCHFWEERALNAFGEKSNSYVTGGLPILRGLVYVK
jgi:hypothetical protein